MMQTLKCHIEECDSITLTIAEKLAQSWRERIITDFSAQSVATRESIILWLLGCDAQRLNLLNTQELKTAKQAMEYRWQILNQRYLTVEAERAYRNLITRLGSFLMLRPEIKNWISLNHNHQKFFLDKLQAVIQEILQNDIYIQQKMADIASITTEQSLKNTLLLATLEEYCLQVINNQPLLLHHFINYLSRHV